MLSVCPIGISRLISCFDSLTGSIYYASPLVLNASAIPPLPWIDDGVILWSPWYVALPEVMEYWGRAGVTPNL